MATEFSNTKSIFILAIVAGCFAILWPNIFYPMLIGSYGGGKSGDSYGGCCDVMFDRDVNAIKIMTELCEKILSSRKEFNDKYFFSFQQGKLTKEVVEACHNAVLDKCGVDITEFLREKVRLGKSYKQMLDSIRSLNSSMCIKQYFGVSIGQIGLPRHMRVWGINRSKHLKQERPPHMRPDLVHPALREKGRAIPQSHVVPKVTIQDGRPGPIPGLRPPMGGAGHVVQPPKGGGTMGIIMPMYTIGIVVFFLYTMMKLMFKKSDDTANNYNGFISDPDFRRAVFENATFKGNKGIVEDNGKLGWKERDARDMELDMLKKKLQETEKAMERIVAQMMNLPHSPVLSKEDEEKEKAPEESTESQAQVEEVKPLEAPQPETKEEDQEEGKGGAVKVVGMEMTETAEKGAKWSRPPTPLSRPSTPQNIYLPGSVPSQSKLLVSDEHTETVSEEDNAVILTGKVTLSLIGLNDASSTEESGQSEGEEHVGGGKVEEITTTEQKQEPAPSEGNKT